MTEAAHLRSLRSIPFTTEYTDGSPTGPCSLTDAEIVLDLIARDWYEDEVRTNARFAARHEGPRGATEWEIYQRMVRTRIALSKHAIKIARLEKSIKVVRGVSGSWLDVGILTRSADGETNYHCLFCDENLATFANRGGKISSEIMARLDGHVDACAMRYCLALVLV